MKFSLSLATTISLLLVISCKEGLPPVPQATPTTEWNEERIVQGVKKISTVQHHHPGVKEKDWAEPQKEAYYITFIEEHYLPEGLISERLIFDRDSSLAYTIRFRYDEHLRLVQKDSIDLFPLYDNGKYSAFTSYAYNADGLTTELVSYLNGSFNGMQKTEYNQRGEVIKRSICSKDSIFSTHVFKYTYDPQGYIAQETKRNAANKDTTLIQNFTYDEKGRLIERKQIYEMTYFGKRREIEHAIITYTYNDNNKLVKRAVNGFDFLPKSTHTYEFDEQGNMILAISDSLFKGYKHSYTYDEKGSWISCHSYDDWGTTIRNRTIEYYE